MTSNKQIINSIKGFLKVARVPNLLIIAFTQYLTAIFLIGNNSDWKNLIFDIRLFFLVLSTVLIAAGGYIINDYYDIKIDYINKPHRVVIGRLLARRKAIIAHIVLSTAGIFIGIFLSLKIAFINFCAVFFLWLYSNDLKRRPFIGNLFIALLTASSLLVVYFLYYKNLILIITYSVFAFSLTIIREIIKDIEDVKGDSTHGCKTIPVLWGIRKTKQLIYLLTIIFSLLFAFLSWILGNEVLIKYFLLLLIPASFFIYKLVKADSQKDFSFLSTYCKGLMLTGILSMIFF